MHTATSHLIRPRSTAALAALATLAALAALSLAGCDDSAKQIRTLQNEVADLKAQKDRLDQQLRENTRLAENLRQQLATLNKMPADRWELVPKPTRLEIEGKSGLRAGKPDLFASPTTQPTDGPVGVFARLYLAVLDADGFPMRAVGPMTISLFDLSTNPPGVLGVYRFTPQQVAKQYTTVFMREIFGLDLPLSAAPKANRLTVRVEFTDYFTGRTFIAEQSLTLSE